MGNLGLPPEERKGYEAYIEGRVLELGLKRGRKELAEEWKAIRRGWYVGGTEFKERMLALVEQPLRQGRSGSYSGEAKRAHGEAEAERLLARGLAALELAARPTGGDEEGSLGKGGVGVVVVPAHHGAAALGERAVGDGRRITSDAGHWPAEAERAAGTGAAEEATGPGL